MAPTERGALKFAIFGAVFGLLIACSGIALLVFVGDFKYVVPALIFLTLLYGWLFYVFVRYRQARQEELLQVVSSSIAAGVPVAPALRAYLQDRPKGPVYHFLVGAILNVCVAPYFWLWHELSKYDRRISHLADELTSGATLTQAFQEVPATANMETRVAAAIGESTGTMATQLKRANRERQTAAWLEVMPRLVYPAILLLFIAATLGFFFATTMPRMKRIYEDFKVPLPAQTVLLIQGYTYFWNHMLLVALVIVFLVIITILLIVSREFRWYCPLFGRLYQWEMQSLILRSLGSLLETQRTVPDSLQLLQSVDDLPAVVRWQLNFARQMVSDGEPLATALKSTGLLPSRMAPLVNTAERTRTLPWTLIELGETRSGKALRLVRRVSIVLGPVLVVGVGILVGLVVMGIFMPLIRLIEGLC